MKKIKKHSPFFIGLALFSMFFGSGNLTFPLFIGQITKNGWSIASIGFLISAVLLPFLGVIAMVINEGSIHTFFSQTGKYFKSKYLIPILLTVWIPLGSAPRCITVAHASLMTYFPHLSLLLFSGLYSILIFFLVYKRQKLLQLIGYILTPLLLAAILCLVITGIFTQPDEIATSEISNLFMSSLTEGYNTMDLIAACFFSASIIKLIKESDVCKKENTLQSRLNILFKASVIGMLILAIVYIGLIFLSAVNADKIAFLQKEHILPYLAYLLLGQKLGMIASLIVLLACITTSCVLVVVFADYLKSLPFFATKHPLIPIGFVLIFCFLFSLIGFGGITALTGPMLQILYPLLILLVLSTIIKKGFFHLAFWALKKRMLTKTKNCPEE